MQGSFCIQKNQRGGSEVNFGEALEALKAGKKLRRAGWNGKGMFVVYQKGYPHGIPCNKQTAEAWGMNEGDLFCVQSLSSDQECGWLSFYVGAINRRLPGRGLGSGGIGRR